FLALCAACSREAATPAAADASAAATDMAGAGAPLETRPRNAGNYEPAFAGQTRAPGIDSGIELDVSLVAEGLNSPWSLEFLPDGRMLVTERPGALRIIGTDGQLSAPATGLPEVLAEGQGGLLDVALDPQFASNRT